MKTYKGRITFARGTYVEFVVAPEEDVDFGDILAVEGKRGDVFFIRVYDFKMKSRWSDMNGVNYLMSKLNAEGQAENQEELDFYLGGNHTAKVGMAEQLCYADESGALFHPKTCPAFFAEVRALTAQDGRLLSELKGDLEVGLLKSGRGVIDLPVGVYGDKTICEHIGVFGTTGSGKSNLIKVLAGSMGANGRYGLLVFDVHNEYYKALAAHPQAKSFLEVYNPQPHQKYSRQLVVDFAEVAPDAVTACASFSEPQLDAIYKLSSLWGESWLRYVLQYDVDDIIEELKGATGQKFQARTVSKIKSVCWNLQQELNIGEYEETVIDDLLEALAGGHVVLVELKDVSPAGEYALSTLLSKKLLEYYRRLSEEEAREKLRPALVVLEEAHRFLGKKAAKAQHNVFAEMVSEARKFNLGMCVVDQQPRLLADQVLSQINTLFILGLASRADRLKLESMCRKDILKQRDEIKNLDCGEVILATNYMRFAAPVKVHKYEEYAARC